MSRIGKAQSKGKKTRINKVQNKTPIDKAPSKKMKSEGRRGRSAGGSSAGEYQNEILEARSESARALQQLRRLFLRHRKLRGENVDLTHKLEQSRGENSQLSSEHNRLSSEHNKLLGKEPGLSEAELADLLAEQHDAHRKTLEEFYKPEARKTLAKQPRFVCSITGQLFIDPVVAEDGHTYEREAIAEWIYQKQEDNNNSNWNSPLNGSIHTLHQLFPNTSMRTEIIEKLETAVNQMIAERLTNIAERLRA
jgi:hypothetical protein